MPTFFERSFPLVAAALVAACSSSSDGGTGSPDASSPDGDVTHADGATSGSSSSGAGQDDASLPSGDDDASIPPGNDASATPDSGVPQDAGSGGGIDAATSDGGVSCNGDGDCRTFSDYCGFCSCKAIGAHAPDPVCTVALENCIIDPCGTQVATCQSGHCTLRPRP